MFAAAVLATLNLIVQVGFVSVMVLVLIVTVMNRMRVRHVRQRWRTGRLLGLPLWPTVSIGAMVLLYAAALGLGQAIPLLMIGGYFVGGLFWWAASLLSGAVLVTEYGLIYPPSRAGHAVAWEQVVDYFETTPASRKPCYVFFYLDTTDTRRRLELMVPRAERAAFSEVIAEKLDTRFAFSAQQVYGKKALEG